jgi:hypothetical protein
MVMRPTTDAAAFDVWCSDGHPLIPIPCQEYVLEANPAPAEDEVRVSWVPFHTTHDAPSPHMGRAFAEHDGLPMHLHVDPDGAPVAFGVSV